MSRIIAQLPLQSLKMTRSYIREKEFQEGFRILNNIKNSIEEVYFETNYIEGESRCSDGRIFNMLMENIDASRYTVLQPY